MKTLDNRYFYYTADDEEPNCIECSFCEGDQKVCNHCGPQCGWANYRRLVLIKEIAEEMKRRFKG